MEIRSDWNFRGASSRGRLTPESGHIGCKISEAVARQKAREFEEMTRIEPKPRQE